MNQYLIPANSKQCNLIFNIFEPIDLIILLTGGVITLLLMLLLAGSEIWVMVVKLLPIGICVLLVMPIPYYHNGRVFLTEAIIFLINQKEYHWKGWCAKYGESEKECIFNKKIC